MELRLHPEPHDPLSCPSCSSSAFTLFAGVEKGLARAECINCGHGFTLSVVEPEGVKIIHTITPTPAFYDAETIRRAIEGGSVSATAGIDAALAARTPYEQGRYAYLAGARYIDNPHAKGFIAHLQWLRGWNAMKSVADEFPGERCHASRDGECNWDQCPQLRDGESKATGRHCPLDLHEEEA